MLFANPLLHPTSVGEAIDDLPRIESGGGADAMAYTNDPQCTYQEVLRKGSSRLFNHECMDLAKVNVERMQHVKPGGSWRDIPFDLLPRGLKIARRSDHTRRYGRLDPTALSGTVLTKCDPHWGTFVHYNQDRVISIREAARIQSFPDWFRFIGPRVSQYRQVGNAVPPLLARHLADHIKKLLKTAQRKKKG
jgi:DNA (cytosine-5)-methyltransferase 1